VNGILKVENDRVRPRFDGFGKPLGSVARHEQVADREWGFAAESIGLHGVAPWREPVVISENFQAPPAADFRACPGLFATALNALLIKVLRGFYVGRTRT
jgi:hypothetical protein